MPIGTRTLEVGYSFLPDVRETLPPANTAIFVKDFPMMSLPQVPFLRYNGSLTIEANGVFDLAYKIDAFAVRERRTVSGILTLGPLDPIDMDRDVIFEADNGGVYPGVIDDVTETITIDVPFLNQSVTAVFTN